LAFPLPNLLSDIEDLLQDVQWLDGLILVTDSERASFVSFSQVDPLLRRLRQRPKGAEVAEKTLYVVAGLLLQRCSEARVGLSGQWPFLVGGYRAEPNAASSPARH
jgi:hypothetical protein